MNYDLKKYNTIFWDFDGVIMDSMDIRDLGFRKVLKKFPKVQVDELIRYHRANGGWSRYVKIQHFLTNIAKTDCSEKIINGYASKFSEIMLDLLVNPKHLIQDSLDFIKANQHYNFHIVSGSDHKELNFICQELGLSSLFISIHGSPIPKIELVKTLLKNYKYSLKDCCLIGDSTNDFEAADANTIDFYGYNNRSLAKKHKVIDAFKIFS